MSISSARLLAHRCCIYMLLLSVASIRISAKTTRAASGTDATVVDPEEKGSDLVSSLTKGKICQYNLTNSSHTLEAKSSIYQHQGFRQCQYFIRAPSSHFILLNFTDIHSKSDMPEEIGLGLQHPQQAAIKTTTTGRTTTAGRTTTTTTTGTTTTTEGIRIPSVTQSSTPSPPPEPAVNRTLHSSKVPQDIQDGKDNATDLELERKVIAEGEHLPSASKDSISDSIASQPSSLHVTSNNNNNNNNNSSYNTSSNIGQLGDLTDSHSKEPSLDDTLPDIGHSELPGNKKESETVKTSRSFNTKDSVRLPESDNSDSSEPRSSLDLPKQSFVGTGAKSKTSDHLCSLKLIIEEVNSSTRSKPQVICWQKSSHPRIPLVYQYSVPVKITYEWDTVSPSGFSLDFSFLKPEEVDCLFKCDSNNHLCLPENQLCDGYDDCPDQSDEKRNACDASQQQHSDDEPHMTVVIAVAVSVTFVIIIVLVLILMISRLRCCNGGSQGRLSLLPPPNSQSSEVCRSTSGSMQDSGQYEALLHHHQHQHQQQQQQQQLLQQQTEAPSVMVAGPRSSVEHRHLLHPNQQHQHNVDQHGNPSNHQQPHLGWDHQLNPTTSLSMTTEAAAAAATLSNDCHRSGRSSWQQQPHNKHHQPHRQARKHTTPNEHFPPQIPLSGDGEEGYAMAQKALHSKRQQDRNWQMENEVFRPPPNKTVYDRDSPPPPYSPPEAKSLDSLVHPVGFVSALRPDRSSHSSQGSPSSVPRSHSLSYHQ